MCFAYQLCFFFHFQEVHAPILSLWGVKLIVVSAFVAFALASIVSCFSFVQLIYLIPFCLSLELNFLCLQNWQALSTRIEPGLEQKIVLPQDSYLQVQFFVSFFLYGEINHVVSLLSVCHCCILFLQGYFNNVSEYLRIGPPLYFVAKNYNYRYFHVISTFFLSSVHYMVYACVGFLVVNQRTFTWSKVLREIHLCFQYFFFLSFLLNDSLLLALLELRFFFSKMCLNNYQHMNKNMI